MDQLFFFSDLPCIDVEDLEGRIDPHLDLAFMRELLDALTEARGPSAEQPAADAA
jgi:hypothetical protein